VTKTWGIKLSNPEQDHDAIHKDEGFMQFYILHWKTEYPTPSKGDTTQIKVNLD
jgi:hypothetical protein